MTSLEDENIDLKKKNNDLAQKLQYWQMIAAERETEKLNLVKEINDLRLKLSKLRNVGANETRKLNAAIQLASGTAITNLVNATNEIAKTMEIAKSYVRDRQELEAQSPRWSTLSNTPTGEHKEKVHRVPPMVAGQSIAQPVVTLSRTLLNTSNPRSERQSPNRAVPLHMLPDVYIPLTRIDAPDMSHHNMGTESDVNNPDDSTENLGLEDGDDSLEELAHRSEDDDFTNRTLHVLHEEEDEMEDVATPRLTLHIDNPLEGPSWLLDTPSDSRLNVPKLRVDRSAGTPRQNTEDNVQDASGVSVRLSCEFSPTVRRRKRTSSPLNTPQRQQQHFSPRPLSRKNNMNGRVLKVLVAKMRLDSDGDNGSSPPKRVRSPPTDSLLSFDAPSPNGATDSGVIVSESRPSHSVDKKIRTDPCISLARLNLSRDIKEYSKIIDQTKIRRKGNSQESQINHHDSTENNNHLVSNRSTDSLTNDRQTVNSQEGQLRHDNILTDDQLNVRNRINSIENELSSDSQQNRSIDEQMNVKNIKKSQECQNHDITESNRPTDRANVTRRTNSLQSHIRSTVMKQERDSVERSGINGHDSHDSRDSDSSSGAAGDSSSQSRSRRPRKMVTYKEKPLNRKLRR